ncbi:MAG TPA: lamin tail domain-containing protein, partial [Phycisphaerae bacterium]|nr:lamin tail domain-containing protein [Phycisphaerae bacterium]
MYSPKFRTHAALAAFAAACPAWRRRRTPFFESLEPRTLLSGNVVINEIHYNPNIDYEAVEFLELTNAGDAPFDLSGARFTNGIDYTFPAGTSLAPGAYVVIAQNPAAVLDKWGLAALGPWTGKLSNEGEKVTLKDAGGTTLDEVNYGINFPWPVTGDYGDSIELINPAFDNSLPGNWRASTLNPAATLLNANATWRYRKGVNEPPSTWKNPGFDEGTDSQPWQNGVTSIGYGDGDDLTNISDMVSSYSSIYLRNTFTITGTVPTSITLRLFVDDGAIVYINGIEVTRAHVSAGNKTYTSLATDHEAAWETFTLSNPSTYLNLGINTIAIHAMNSTLDSSDFSIDCQLIIPAGGISGATPGAKNSDFAVSTPPLLDKLTQSVQQPVAGQDMTITIKASDPSGIQSVVLQYQTVDPGSYIRYTDAAYKTSWTSLAMHDDGLNGDAAALDGIYSVTIPASVQTNRRLVRYRIIATDATNASLQVPYTSDTQPNFAYYVYNGVPAWTGANQPGVTAPVTFGTDITNSLPVYQLIANNTDVTNSQYVSNYNDMPFYATMVYDGVVYDDIIFTNRGEFSTYVSGKNKWAIKFNTGHLFAARDNYGNLYSEKWRRIDLNTNAEPWLMVNRGMAGLDESVSHRLFQLAGIASPNTNYVQFRVVDAAAEAPAGDQYGGDMWGLYLAVEHTGSHWLDEHNLADGNVYEIVNSVGDSRTLSPDQVSDGSDWNNLLANIKVTSTPLSYWQDNINLEEFYSFNAISRVTSNVDLRPTYNHVMYHAPDGHWQIIPWDLDMMMVPETHQLGQTYLNNMFVYPTLKTDYANRA